MIASHFTYLDQSQIAALRDKVLEFLKQHGVKLDPHQEMLEILADAGARVDSASGMVRFPRPLLEDFLQQAPKTMTLGARTPQHRLQLPRPDGTFYARSGTGSHGWIDPETDYYRKVSLEDLANWAKLINRLDEISFLPFLFPDDAPTASADVHALAVLLKNSDKHLWVQPYSAQSVEYLIRLATAVAGGEDSLRENPLISMIACSLTPRAFKHMDLEIILRSARLGLPIHACSLPGAGGTAPATMPGVVILATAEILAMVAMAQAVAPGAPVIACPIIFSTDMKTGRSLQASVEAISGAALAIQFIKAAFGLPTHNYGSGSDAPLPDGQSMSERAMLTTFMAASGLDILGGAGQLEVATTVSPLQLMVDNEVFAMARHLMTGFELSDDQLAWEVLVETEPGQHFLTSRHTLMHCRDAFTPHNFIRCARGSWEREVQKDLWQRVREQHRDIMSQENTARLPQDQAQELDAIVQGADRRLCA